jgi:hypothetical protein
MVTTIALKDNYASQIIPDSWDKNIKVCLVDEVNNFENLFKASQRMILIIITNQLK